MLDLREKTIAITGGNGFLGTHLKHKLSQKGIKEADPSTLIRGIYSAPSSKMFDLTKAKIIKKFYEKTKPDIVIHLAAVVGGIGANMASPGTFYFKNLIMGALLMEEARQRSIEKFVAIGTICAYPKFTSVPFKEEDLWNGYPEETNAPYGIAKKAMLVQSQAYREEFGFNSIYLLPVNLYGPKDNFNLKTSHVIPAIIKKCVNARNNNASSITCWGTGTATREFLYVEDAADAIIAATEHYDKSEPVNIGSGVEISIGELVEKIAKLTKFTGSIIWDKTLPDGQPRRCLDTTKAKREFGFSAKTSLDDGLGKTIEWYEKHITHND